MIIAPTSSNPQFAFRQNTVVVVDGVNWLIQQRLSTGQWLLLQMETGETNLIRDNEIAQLQGEGRFHLHQTSSKVVAAPAPLSPVVIGEKVRAANLRKHEYVQACQGLPRSRKALLSVIASVAQKLDEPAPGFTSVLNWMDEFEAWAETFGTAAYSDRHDLKGTRGSRLPAHLDRAIDVGLEAWLQLQNCDLAYAVVRKEVSRIDEEEGHTIDKLSLPECYVDPSGRLLPPSLRTFQRRCKNENRLVVDLAHFGEGHARKHNRTWATRDLPDRPYQEVEVDHCTLDITLVDAGGLVVGRPDLVCFRDRATAMVLGFGVGLDGPSYASFLEGLKHTIYPKELPETITTAWPCYGRIDTLVVDGALHFLGDSIANAGRELGFSHQVCPPRQPWMKGALERFFRTLGVGLIHRLPGTTLSNVVDRNEHEHLGAPAITLEQFRHILTKWICEIYHVDVTKALGPIRGMGAQPLATWQEKAVRFITPPLPSRDIFIALAGQVDHRTIQKDGIVWDHIKYESPALSALLQHPQHRRRSSEGSSSRYKVLRDPQNLGEIVVVNPYDNVPIQVPATLGHREYAEGLTLHQHQVVLANVKAANRNVALDDLVEAKAALANLAMQLLHHPGRRGVEKAVARFIGADKMRGHRSKIEVDKPNDQYASLKALLAPEPHPASGGPASFIEAPCEEADDLDFLRSTGGFAIHIAAGGPLA
jgi:putative transposase